MGAQKNRLIETVLLSTDNICKKIKLKLTLQSQTQMPLERGVWSGSPLFAYRMFYYYLN